MAKWKIWDQEIKGMDHGQKGEYGRNEKIDHSEMEDIGSRIQRNGSQAKWKIWDQGIRGIDHGRKGEYGRNEGMDHDEIENMGSRIWRNGSWVKGRIWVKQRNESW